MPAQRVLQGFGVNIVKLVMIVTFSVYGIQFYNSLCFSGEVHIIICPQGSE